MTEPTPEENEQAAYETNFLTDILGRLLANRPIAVAFGTTNNFIAEIATQCQPATREVMAIELERLAVYIRNLPTDNEESPALPVGNTLN